MPTSTATEPRFFSPADAAVFTGLSARTLRRLAEAGKIRALKPTPNRVVYDRIELERYLDSCATANGIGTREVS